MRRLCGGAPPIPPYRACAPFREATPILGVLLGEQKLEVTTKITAPTLAAQRMRRYRRRRRRGLLAVRAEVGPEVVDTLIAHGWLSADEARDPKAVGAALVAWARSTLTMHPTE